jgi:hypothetical protein
MRTCANCKVIDRPVMDFSRDCSQNCNPAIRDSGNAEDHGQGCNKVLHEVRQYVRSVILVITPKSPEGAMPRKWVSEGWTFKRDGSNCFRWKMLCRNCIEREVERDMVHRDYLKACKAARGEDDRTYGQLMIQQAQS